jgi:hypothetical protein
MLPTPKKKKKKEETSPPDWLAPSAVDWQGKD